VVITCIVRRHDGASEDSRLGSLSRYYGLTFEIVRFPQLSLHTSVPTDGLYLHIVLEEVVARRRRSDSTCLVPCSLVSKQICTAHCIDTAVTACTLSAYQLPPSLPFNPWMLYHLKASPISFLSFLGLRDKHCERRTGNPRKHGAARHDYLRPELADLSLSYSSLS
jgi:hypothetical protein